MDFQHILLLLENPFNYRMLTSNNGMMMTNLDAIPGQIQKY
jgi:hypothetical protein